MTRSIYLPPWRVDVDVRDGVRAPVAHRRLTLAIGTALEMAGAPRPASIGLILTGDAEITALNERYLGEAGPTDVLSFPLLPPDAYPPHPGKHATASGDPFPLPPGRRAHLGDIVVSVERAIEQAEGGRGGQTGDVRWSAAHELRLLVIHGTLHLCGWDHADRVEERAMRALERDLLETA
jgi:probable rRNA maturation factor